MTPLHWKLLGGGLLIALAYYAFKPVSKITFYDPEIITAMASANAAGVANPTNS